MTHKSDPSPDDLLTVYAGGDGPPTADQSADRRRREVDSLLSMAEELQMALERKNQQFLTSSLWLIFSVAAGLAGFAIAAFTSMTVVYKISLTAGIALCLGITVLLLYRNQLRFEVQRRRDRSALNEVLTILHDVEPILQATSDWSRLDEAQFRIRLARFDVGRSNKPMPNVSDLRIDRFTRTMRFLLDETNSPYRQFVEKLFQNIDVAVKNLMEARDFDDVLRRGGARLEVVGNDADFNAIVDESRRAGSNSSAVTTRLVAAQWGGSMRNYAIFQDGRTVINAATKREFDSRQQQLRIQLDGTHQGF